MLILDAGAFVAAERGDREVLALVKRERGTGRTPVTNGGVVAQVWRGGSGRQVPVAQLLAGVEVAPVDDRLGRRAGTLLARTGSSDAIDAALLCLAQDGDDILTSDPSDLVDLARAAGVHVEIIPVLSRKVRPRLETLIKWRRLGVGQSSGEHLEVRLAGPRAAVADDVQPAAGPPDRGVQQVRRVADAGARVRAAGIPPEHEDDRVS